LFFHPSNPIFTSFPLLDQFVSQKVTLSHFHLSNSLKLSMGGCCISKSGRHSLINSDNTLEGMMKGKEQKLYSKAVNLEEFHILKVIG